MTGALGLDIFTGVIFQRQLDHPGADHVNRVAGIAVLKDRLAGRELNHLEMLRQVGLLGVIEELGQRNSASNSASGDILGGS
ncbi:MAG: hypothetical protein M3O82_03380 [Verrucomicrobiota bacterium]|nr:hypothetical protein [Verrucomicrobiota bacterium]